MIKILIWGTGKYVNNVFDSIELDKCKLLGLIDNNIDKQGSRWKEQYMIYSPQQAVTMGADYYIISATVGKESILKQAEVLGIDSEKMILFWEQDVGKFDFINKYKKENHILKINIDKLQLRLKNAPYEYGPETIKIESAQELLKKIYIEKCSLCRFGDGEFDIILNQERSWFQKYNEKMAETLKNILQSDDERIIIAIANNYGNLDVYTENAADSIRKYMTPQKRKQHMDLLNESRVYYDAYVSRPYIMYKNKNENAEKIFNLYKKIFKDRNIIMVEGKHTKTGARNDLFQLAKSVRRILCPDMNAYDSYEKIVHVVKQHVEKNDLVLISLGATATILAYDLAICGIQAIDFGQLDNEYEWYVMQASDRTVIEGKSVSELSWYKIPQIEMKDDEYNKQIVATVY